MDTILIIDDDDQLRKSFEKLMVEEGYRVRTAASGEAGLEEMRAAVPDLVILDMRLPGMGGLETFRAIHALEPKLPVIIMTAYGTTETAIEATKCGAFDYVLKPFDIPGMLALIAKALEAGRFMRSPVDLDAMSTEASREAIVGRSPAMQAVYKAIGRVAATNATVLIRGESGTGKELVARAIYQHSDRADKPFLVINCVAIPETLLESELFGYEKGAFTGAVHRRIGKLEQANGGTVFLDEIGDISPSVQVKLLRVLQERSFERVGGAQPIEVDVRIVAATHRDLKAEVAAGRFREDLYYRLNVFPIALPPLADRKESIVPLAEYFAGKFAAAFGKRISGFSGDAVDALRRYPWPGNVRELQNVIERAVILAPGEIDAAHLRLEASAGPETSAGAAIPGEGALRANERETIRKVLADTGGNRTQAARVLGISLRTLQYRIKEYGL